MHPTTPCAVVYKFFAVFLTVFFTVFLQVFYSFFTVFFYSFLQFLTVFFTFFTVFYKAVEWAGDFGAGDLGGLLYRAMLSCVGVRVDVNWFVYRLDPVHEAVEGHRDVHFSRFVGSRAGGGGGLRVHEGWLLPVRPGEEILLKDFSASVLCTMYSAL